MTNAKIDKMLENCQEILDAGKKPKMKLLEGKPVAEELLSCYAKPKYKQAGKSLVLFASENNSSAQSYAKSLRNIGKKYGVEVTLLPVPEHSRDLATRLVHDASSSWSSAMILTPIKDEYYLTANLNLFADLDCQCLELLGRFFKTGENAPITPTACIKILEYYKIPLDGKKVAVVGRSNTVGKPLALLCLDKNATVTVCHSHTTNLKEVLQNSDIIISAVGKAGFITQDMINLNAVIIDVGINVVDGKVVGDVDPNVICKAKTPVPNGVGVVSSALAIKKTIEKHL